MKNGQILILVLLVVVVSLAVGLSVASRNITNLRTSTQTGESQRAFSAAEGGVEDVLSRLETIKNDPLVTQSTGKDEFVPIGDLTATVNVKGFKVYQMTLVPGEVGQINLSGYPSPAASGEITVEWILSSTSEDAFPRASIELTFVCENSITFCTTVSTGIFSQRRFAFQAEPITGQSGFASCVSGTGFVCKNPASTFVVIPANNVRILRIRPFHNTATIKVSGSPDLPTQIYKLNSVAKTDIGTTRRVEVTRTVLPVLPAMFDYALYSEGDIVK